jgi:hypothetical protein
VAVLGDGLGDWGAPWEALARPPAAYQADALAALLRTLEHLAIAAAAIAALCLALHTLSRILSQWRSLAIRHALGATTRHLLPLVGWELAGLGAAGAVLGLGAGALVLIALTGRWPELLTQPALVLSAVVAAAVALIGAWAVLGLIAVVLLTILQRGVRTVSELHGSNVTASGPLLLIQSALAVLQLAGLLIVTYGTLLIATDSAAPQGAGSASLSDSTVAAPLTFASRESRVRAAGYRRLTQLVKAEGPARVALASPDAWLGEGKELLVLAICDECSVGAVLRPLSAGYVRVVAAAPRALSLLGAPVTRGRGIVPADTAGAAPVAVVNLAAAYALFPGGNPLGKPIIAGTTSQVRYTVVGVTSFEAPPVFGNPAHVPVVFVAAFQHPPRRAEAIAPTALWNPDLRRIRAVTPDAGAPLPDIGEGTPLARRRNTFRAPLVWFGVLFAVLALSGTGIAVYSLVAVMNETVRLREREIAIRLALGAQATHIQRWVARRTLRITMAGVVVGLSGARWLGVLLHGPVRSAEGDVALLGVMALVFAALGLLASWLPARRAARVAPAAAFAEIKA